ncbi:MAG: restriction endonuclease subunit S [Candidatus Accumulibacter sp.]|nr:restriction endonuclease subunit S [Accumulibacter sp.]
MLASPESKEWLIRHAFGATMPRLNTEILAGVPITLPPIEEQRAIARILGTLDDKIELSSHGSFYHPRG